MQDTSEESEPNSEVERIFDLEERAARFGENVIRFCRRQLKQDAISSPVIKQLIRSATSIGANYCESCESGTRKEFRYRISLCRREARETKHWLRMIGAACEEQLDTSRALWREAHELTLIFAKIYRNTPKEE